MAYIKKVQGGYQVSVRRKGFPGMYKTLATRKAAEAWGAQMEADISMGRAGAYPRKTVAEAFTRYELSVSTKKKGTAFEARRFNLFIREFPWLAEMVFSEVTTAELARWRDERLTQVSASTVLREVSLFRNVWTIGRKEWGWCGESPWSNLGMPRKAAGRTRLALWQEMRLILRRLDYSNGCEPDTLKREVAFAWLLAHYTALRAGEVRGLTVDSVNLDKMVVYLATHKTDSMVGSRIVPLFPRAFPLLRRLIDYALKSGRKELFTISDRMLDALFRKYRDQVLVENLRFHDSRGFALTWMAKRVSVMVLARISGHKNLNMLLEHYYRETSEQIAAGLS